MLIKESLSFERGIDPKKQLGIGGIFHLRDFETMKECYDFVADNILEIINRTEIPDYPFHLEYQSKIPDDMITVHPSTSPDRKYDIWMKGRYANLIHHYICIYTSVKGENYGLDYRRLYRALKRKKLIKESLSFERGKDPKDVLGIGIDRKNFNSKEEFLDTLVLRIPKILGKKEIPKDIIANQGHLINPEYVDAIWDDLFNRNIIINGILICRSGDFDIYLNSVEDKLKELGFKKKIDESISFERGKDPREVLNIGHYQYDNEIIEKIKKTMRENLGHLTGDDLKYDAKLRIILVTKDVWSFRGIKCLYDALDSLEKGSLKDKIQIINSKNNFIVKIL